MSEMWRHNDGFCSPCRHTRLELALRPCCRLSLSLSEARTCFVGRYCLQCCFAHCLSHVTVGKCKRKCRALVLLKGGRDGAGGFFLYIFF